MGDEGEVKVLYCWRGVGMDMLLPRWGGAESVRVGATNLSSGSHALMRASNVGEVPYSSSSGRRRECEAPFWMD